MVLAVVGIALEPIARGPQWGPVNQTWMRLQSASRPEAGSPDSVPHMTIPPCKLSLVRAPSVLEIAKTHLRPKPALICWELAEAIPRGHVAAPNEGDGMAAHGTFEPRTTVMPRSQERPDHCRLFEESDRTRAALISLESAGPH